MVTDKFKKGFSLVEALILIVGLAIAVAATTPIITRKIANIQDAGATLGGGTHGRYEVFYKEIATFPDDDSDWEKTGGGDDGEIIVYERKDDNTFKTVVGKEPLNDTDKHRKATLYEEIPATPIENSDGSITSATIKKNNKKITITKGTKYIFEPASIEYYKGKLTGGSDPDFERKGNTTLSSQNKRVIEGNLTVKLNKKIDNHTLWLFDFNKSDPKPEVTVIPTECLYSGKKTVYCKKIENKDPDGNPIAEFTPPKNASNIVVHAVGGGGAGGGPVKNDNSYILKGKSASDPDVIAMKKILAQRVRKLGISGTDDQLVKVINNSNASHSSRDPLNGAWVGLNTANGTITVRFDIRQGKIFPHELLDYTKILGAATQTSLIYDMPEWFTWNNLANSKFCAGGVAIGTAGGPGGDFIWKTNGDGAGPGEVKGDDMTTASRKDLLGTLKVKYKVEKYNETSCPQYVNCHYPSYYGLTYCPYGTTAYGSQCCQVQYVKKKTSVVCKAPKLSSYYDIDSDETFTKTGSCSSPVSALDCTNVDVEFHRNSKRVTRTYKGQAAGAGGGKAIAASRITGITEVFGRCTAGSSDKGANCTITKSTLPSTAPCSNGYGGNGRTCYVMAGKQTGISTGGMGGAPCIQTQTTVERDETMETLVEGANTVYQAAGEGVTGIVGTAIAFTAAQTEKLATEAISQLGYGADITVGNKLTNGAYIYSGDGIKIYNALGLFADITVSTSNSLISQVMTLDTAWLNKSVPGHTYQCEGSPGASGIKIDGVDPYCTNNSYLGIGSNPGQIYNYIYHWTIPFTMNYLTYGEGGNAGEYKSTKVSKIDGTLKINLGKGGAWTNSSWAQGKNGPDGTATTVDLESQSGSTKRILTAKGGKGGKGSLQTNRYDLCHAKVSSTDQTCKNPAFSNGTSASGGISNSTVCCSGSEPTRTSQEILTTAIKYSAFETIKSLVGGSNIIGIGLGRGGEGAGTRSGEQELYGYRTITNTSSSVNWPKISVLNENSKGTAPKNNQYKNSLLEPAALNFKGGDGAVIITW